LRNHHNQGQFITASTANGTDYRITQRIQVARERRRMANELSSPVYRTHRPQQPSSQQHARQEIKISDAFAHLAVGEHDVAALTTNYGSPDGTNLRFVACTNNPPIGENLPISTQPVNLMSQVWHLMLTWNVLRDEEESSSKDPHPTIISPSKPDDLGERNAFTYMVGLELRCECSVITLSQCTLTY